MAQKIGTDQLPLSVARWQQMTLLYVKHLFIEKSQNGTARFKKCKQLFEYKYLVLLRDIWWSCCSFFQHQC
jgi:hypothetical protein